jgi:hypothetical protein
LPYPTYAQAAKQDAENSHIGRLKKHFLFADKDLNPGDKQNFPTGYFSCAHWEV